MHEGADGSIDRLATALLAGEAAIAVVGLGYVGLPLARCLAGRFAVIGYDVDQRKVAELAAGQAAAGLRFSADAAVLAEARLLVICVPTPIDEAKRPDLGALLAATRAVGEHLRPGSCVVYESTVYPGCTEEVCIPALEAASGLRLGQDFAVGYSPERINPGDERHTVDRVVKIVSGSDAVALDLVAAVYGAVIPVGLHRAPSIKVAEAAKVMENTQRDLNIALINELALICHRLEIDTRDVLEAAGSKWNFLPFTPGLVGGHCIGVDPYYLTYRAEVAGYHPQVILSGRRINDGLGSWIAQECIRLMGRQGRGPQGARVLVLGLTYKADCPDCRYSKVFDVIAELRRWGCEPVISDPLADLETVAGDDGIALTPLEAVDAADACILAVAHQPYRRMAIAELLRHTGGPVPLLDVQGVIDRQDAADHGCELWRL